MRSIAESVKSRVRRATHAKKDKTGLGMPPKQNEKNEENARLGAITEQNQKKEEGNTRLSTITEQNQLKSAFLRLPGEIRNTIYHYALAGHEIYAMGSGLRPFVCMARPDTQFAWNLKPIAQIMAIHLPLVCRQIRSETGEYFVFKYNSFGSTMAEYFQLLMKSLTVEQKSRIEVVRMNFASHYSMESAKPYSELGGLQNLKLLVLRNVGGSWEQSWPISMRSFREVAGKQELEIEIQHIC